MTITVELGRNSGILAERMASGHYNSPGEVIAEALEALDREDALLEEILSGRLGIAMKDDAVPAKALERI